MDPEAAQRTLRKSRRQNLLEIHTIRMRSDLKRGIRMDVSMTCTDIAFKLPNRISQDPKTIAGRSKEILPVPTLVCREDFQTSLKTSLRKFLWKVKVPRRWPCQFEQRIASKDFAIQGS